MKRSVLVLGDDLRSFLSVARSLGEKGIAVDCCSLDHGAPALRSRYLRIQYRFPPYGLDPKAWIRKFISILEKNQYDLVIPTSDVFILPLVAHAELLAGHNIALPTAAMFTFFYDKRQTRRLAEQVGVPISRGRGLTGLDTAESLVSRFGLPLIIKPRRSFDLGVLDNRNQVFKPKTPGDARQVLSRIKNRDAYIVEQYFDGIGVGVSVLADHGEVLLAFQHQRVNEPPDGGGSSYRMSVPLDPVLLDRVQALCRATALTGVTMFEFKKNMVTGASVLIEVNARFWGSLPLAVWSGVDFPWHLFRLMTARKRPGRSPYKTGRYGRNLTADLYYLSMMLGTSRSGYDRVHALAGFVSGLANLALGREKVDAFSFRDPMPFILEAENIAAQVFRKVFRKLPYHGAAASYIEKKRMRQALEKNASQPLTLVVICSGNICRSPFGGYLLEKRLKRTGHGVHVLSCGLIPREGRPCPDHAVSAAAAYDIDMVAHRSVWATDAVLEEAGLVFVFDEINQEQLKARGLNLEHKTIQLGTLIGRASIPDPYGGSLDHFKETYVRIARGMDVVEQLAGEYRGNA